MPLSKNSDLAFFVNRVIDWSSSNSTSLPALLLSGSIKQGAIPAFRSSPRFLVQPSPPAQKQIEKEIKPPIEYQVDSLFIYFSLSLDILHSRSVPMSKSRMCLEQDWWPVPVHVDRAMSKCPLSPLLSPPEWAKPISFVGTVQALNQYQNNLSGHSITT